MNNTTIPTISWEGVSAREYQYGVYPVGTVFRPGPANYIYTRETRPGFHVPIYIGETGDIADRNLDSHHRKEAIERHGATHICVHSSGSRLSRLAEETDLRHRWRTPCNRQ